MKLNITMFVLGLPLVLACSKRTTDEELAQTQSALQAQIDALSQSLADQQTQIAQLQLELGDLAAVVDTKADAAPLEWLDDLHTVLYTVGNGDGTVTVYFDGGDVVVTRANLYVQTGMGSTSAPAPGLGNLIVGYNETAGSELRTGYHNLIVGPYHSYAAYGGLLAGYQNTVLMPFGSVTGGEQNTVDAANGAICGGVANLVSGTDGVVAGGQGNEAGGSASSVLGGYANVATGQNASVGGGSDGVASGDSSMVVGGYQNSASGVKSVVGGGWNNEASGETAAVACGSSTTNALPATCAP